MPLLTVGEIREMIAGLPDNAPVIIDVRCVDSDDYFHDPLVVDSHGLGVGDPDCQPVLSLGEVGCNDVSDEHPDGGHPVTPFAIHQHYRRNDA